MNLRDDLFDRFWNKVDTLEGFATDEDCWLWTGAKEKAGYGSFNFMGITRRASRVSYQLFKGRKPAKQICHTCDNRLCVNPNHLVDEDQSFNIQDSIRKGRFLVGERDPKAKLSNLEVEEIINLVHSGHTQLAVARKFNLNPCHVSRIMNGKRRKHG